MEEKVWREEGGGVQAGGESLLHNSPDNLDIWMVHSLGSSSVVYNITFGLPLNIEERKIVFLRLEKYLHMNCV